MCIDNLIYAFTYSVLKDISKTTVVFKILPTKNFRELYWNSLYMKLIELKEYKKPMQVFVVREILCRFKQENLKCLDCKKNLYQKDQCWNTSCTKFTPINIESLLIQAPVAQLSLTTVEFQISKVYGDKQQIEECYRCSKCKRCVPNKKCYLHRICKHKINHNINSPSNTNHFFNRLALRNSLQKATNKLFNVY
ncbi:HgNV_097 [Dikerogammarus haemobaphes nudivirus]|nr:HgNV_097 [Dikerogammarus haemobaphes nudivirus]